MNIKFKVSQPRPVSGQNGLTMFTIETVVNGHSIAAPVWSEDQDFCTPVEMRSVNDLLRWAAISVSKIVEEASKIEEVAAPNSYALRASSLTGVFDSGRLESLLNADGVEVAHLGPGGECPHCGQVDCRCHEEVGQ